MMANLSSYWCRRRLCGRRTCCDGLHVCAEVYIPSLWTGLEQIGWQLWLYYRQQRTVLKTKWALPEEKARRVQQLALDAQARNS
jgi:hypothetical protein